MSTSMLIVLQFLLQTRFPKNRAGTTANNTTKKLCARRPRRAEAGLHVYSGKLSAGQVLVTPMAHMLCVKVLGQNCMSIVQTFVGGGELALQRGTAILKALPGDQKQIVEGLLDKIAVSLAK